MCSVKKLCIIVLSMCGIAFSCPPEEDIAPSCFCEDRGSGPMLGCYYIQSVDELMLPIKNSEPYNVYSLAVSNSTLLYLSSDLFHNMRFRVIRFMFSQLMALSDSDVAFEGLENYLEKFQIEEGHFVANWEWSQLRKLKKLEEFEVKNIVLSSVDEPFPAIETLQAIGLIDADISFIVEKAFAELKNLRIFSLKGNSLTELKRNMLPNPAEKLMFLDLRENKLSNLPANMFEGMPSLIAIELDNNQFSTFTEAAFGWLFDNLDDITLRGNPIKCDCRLHWTVGRMNYGTKAKCDSPENLKGRDLYSIDKKSLRCLLV